METNFLHILASSLVMLIALPNLDGSFTCTLFFPFEGDPSFSSVKSETDAEPILQKIFS